MHQRMQLFDSHTHLSSEEMVSQLQALLPNQAPPIIEWIEEGRAVGVKAMVNICTEEKSLERGLKLAQETCLFFNAAATPPHDASLSDPFFEQVKEAALQGKLVAIGETGLDYYYEQHPKEVQQKCLRRYLQLAKELKLPVVIHCREAFADFFAILDEEGGSIPGILHCFTGTLAEAKEVIKRGWYLSFSGIVTFKKSHELRAIAKEIPIEQLLIETDAPFLAPQSFRGKVNRPAYLLEVAKVIAQEREIALEDLASTLYCNTLNAFQLPQN